MPEYAQIGMKIPHSDTLWALPFIIVFHAILRFMTASVYRILCNDFA